MTPSPRLACTALVLLAGCVLSKESLGKSDGVEPQPEVENDSGDASDSSPASDDAVGSGLDPSTGADGEPGADITPAACEGLDHEGCYADVLAACQQPLQTTPQCAEAVEACYDLGPPQVATLDLYGLCRAELFEECLGESSTACGAQYCACAAGGYPFDWTNCFHLVSVSCIWGQSSDCEGAIDVCYPGETLSDIEACYEPIRNECDCPMCGVHEMCEAKLAACLDG